MFDGPKKLQKKAKAFEKAEERRNKEKLLRRDYNSLYFEEKDFKEI